ncbi:MAG: hypothetical protein HYR63_08240 [Proteobacteria bacterium]|nr:hypothetical protein [Pseudomonadota bacterium]MBI3497729.1 hypothetical protein [Pseudomonadota bacterium]
MAASDVDGAERIRVLTRGRWFLPAWTAYSFVSPWLAVLAADPQDCRLGEPAMDRFQRGGQQKDRQLPDGEK